MRLIIWYNNDNNNNITNENNVTAIVVKLGMGKQRGVRQKLGNSNDH